MDARGRMSDYNRINLSLPEEEKAMAIVLSYPRFLYALIPVLLMGCITTSPVVPLAPTYNPVSSPSSVSISPSAAMTGSNTQVVTVPESGPVEVHVRANDGATVIARMGAGAEVRILRCVDVSDDVVGWVHVLVGSREAYRDGYIRADLVSAIHASLGAVSTPVFFVTLVPANQTTPSATLPPRSPVPECRM